MKILNNSEYTLIGIIKGNKLYAELESGIVKICWTGLVDLKSSQEMLLLAIQLLEDDLCNKIILDRKELTDFTEEAKAWIKEEIRTGKAPLIIDKIKKIATIKPSCENGAALSDLINASIRDQFPTLELTQFDSSQAADEWLIAA